MNNNRTSNLAYTVRQDISSLWYADVSTTVDAWRVTCDVVQYCSLMNQYHTSRFHLSLSRCSNLTEPSWYQQQEYSRRTPSGPTKGVEGQCANQRCRKNHWISTTTVRFGSPTLSITFCAYLQCSWCPTRRRIFHQRLEYGANQRCSLEQVHSRIPDNISLGCLSLNSLLHNP